ncbi:NF-kappa-B inhibitor zeta [Cebidichthys violaceus]|uniref:NF-kappa-B inhibitor zeta n=1 Tax=Cebidichthys violaceus TaxID=271503 RepID=UPI0035CA9695
MGGRSKRRELKEAAGLSPLPETHSPVPGFTGTKGSRCSLYGDEKVYLGVRVKMPVRDLLKKIRIDKGWEPHDLQNIHGKSVKGDGQKVKMRAARRSYKRKRSTKSLEELAIIVEVLEEDLRTGNTCRSSPQSLPSPNPPVSPGWSQSGYNSDESDEMIPSPDFYGTSSPGSAGEYQQAWSPPGFTHTGLQPSGIGGVGGGEWEWADTQNQEWNLNNSTFFWAQLQREESQLEDISDAELLAHDEHGRTTLHKVACIGKRALGYAIAKRMAALNSLDLKDSDGMTALLHAAKHNHHLMVEDLILLGANVNETNNSGKSCLHLSAERGYIRVLEVLKNAMLDGVYVDVEATDNSGICVLQCASLALKATVRKLENSKFPNQTRLHTLRQEQIMETLECLLQMGSYLHTMGSQSMQPRFG